MSGLAVNLEEYLFSDIIPKKIKAKVYLDMLKKLEEEGGDNEDT